MINKIFDALKQQHKNNALSGSIIIKIDNIEIRSSNKSAVGNCIEEWIGEWMNVCGFSYSRNTDSQSFPDYWILDKNQKKLALEIKCFDIENGPGFDVAQFDTYTRKLPDHPEILDCSYLIIMYSLSNKVLRIEDLWLKKIWEITQSTPSYPIQVQKKQEIIHNIRPFKWYSSNKKSFKSKEDFICALNKLVQTNSQSTTETKNKWKDFIKKLNL